MFKLQTTLLLLFSTIIGFSQSDIWVVSNVALQDESAISKIKANPDFSKDDILIYHGNALNKIKKKEAKIRIGELRESFKRVYLVPGKSEWDRLKSKKLKSWGDYFDKEFKGDVIVPENSCGQIEVKKVGDDLAIVFFDSEWYFKDWQNDKNLNKKCEVSSRGKFWAEVRGEIGKLKARQVVLVARHPVQRYDKIGGHHSVKEHIFPLTSFVPGLYIPMPILGTVISDTKQYLKPGNNVLSPLYRQYTSQLEHIIDGHPHIIMLSSDALVNTLEKRNDSYHININSSDKSLNHYKADVEYLNESQNYLQLHIEEKQVESKFWDFENNSTFSVNIKSNSDELDDDDKGYESANMGEMVNIPIRPDDQIVKLPTFLFGSLHKGLYNKEVVLPQLDLNTEVGGLKALRLGGGMQTKSLRLEDSEGRSYVARSLKKVAEKTLPLGMDYKPLVKAMDYFFMAGHPVSFMVAPTLDSAANLLYTTPQLMYLPKQEGLGGFNSDSGDDIILFRERATGNWENKESFGNSKKIISSADMIIATKRNKARPNSNMFLRARLLDLVLGDWDRHADQWRWAKDPGDHDMDIYHPIARDRDQAFANFDGLALTLLRPFVVNFLQMRKYDNDLIKADIRWMHWKSAYLDNSVLHKLTDEEWVTEAENIKKSLTPEIVDQAIANLPDSFSENKEEVKAVLNYRIKNIDKTAQLLKTELRHLGFVQASNEKDSIIITQFEDRVHVKVIADYNEKGRNIKYDGPFLEKSTKRLWIYGLEGDDIIVMKGKTKSSIDIKVIGGYNKDQYISHRNHKNITILDDQSKSKIKATTPTKYRKIASKDIHDVTRFDFTPQHKFFFPALAFNTDDGFVFGGAYTWNNRRFKSSNSHQLKLSYATKRANPSIGYSYNSFDELTNFGYFFDSKWSGLDREINFYGGNESPKTGTREFHEVQIKDYKLEGGVVKQVNSISKFKPSVYGWSARVLKDNSQATFIGQTPLVSQDIFKRQYFGGLKLKYEIGNFDNAMKPSAGARISLISDYKYNFTGKRSNILLGLEYDYYKDFFRNEYLIFSTKIRAQHMFGDYYIYEVDQIGGTNMLRGFINGRFTGRSLLVNNNNLHVKIFDTIMKNFLPSSFGISGAFDHGRVWNDNSNTNDWHTSFGFGLWLAPLDMTVISISQHRSKEDNLLRIKMGWQF